MEKIGPQGTEAALHAASTWKKELMRTVGSACRSLPFMEVISIFF